MACASKTKQGFTLIEVLVALVVLAAIGLTLVQTSDTGTDHSRYLQHKLFASWIAEDRATALRLAYRLGEPIALDETIVEQGGERFLTKLILAKQTDFLQRIEIQVFDLSGPQSTTPARPIYGLVTYLPQMALKMSDREGNHDLP